VTDVGSWLVAEVVGVRVARPEDYDCIAAVIDAWWGRPVSASVGPTVTAAPRTPAM